MQREQLSSKQVSLSITSFQLEKYKQMNLKELGIVPKLFPYMTTKYKVVDKKYEQLNEEMRKLWHIIFIGKQESRKAEKQEINLEHRLPFIPKKSDVFPICNHNFTKTEKIYKCYDCSQVLYSVYCEKCFTDGNHKGHTFTTINYMGGFCECGNKQVYKEQGFCKNHSGKVNRPKIPEKQRKIFLLYMNQLHQWFVDLQSIDGYEGIALLIHLIGYMSKLNNQSLYYIFLTFEWQKQKPSYLNGISVLEHLLIMGAKYSDSFLAKKATNMFLKMWCLQDFRIQLTQQVLIYYNKIDNFQTSDFRGLLLQFFLNSHVISKIFTEKGSSLNPKQRSQYNSIEYFNQLLIINSMKPDVARTIFLPIINSGGVDFCQLRYIKNQVEKGKQGMESVFKQNWRIQHQYYEIIKGICSKFQKEPIVLARQIKNQLILAQTYTYTKNRVIIPHQRAFAIYILVYFKCDLMEVDPYQLIKICEMTEEAFLQAIESMLILHLSCIMEFSKSLAHMLYDNYIFDEYIDRYVKDKHSCKFFNFDSLALKIIGIIFDKLNKSNKISQILIRFVQGEENNIRVANCLYKIQQQKDIKMEKMKMVQGKRQKEEGFFHGIKRFQKKSYQESRQSPNTQSQSAPQLKKYQKQYHEKLSQANTIYVAQTVHFILLVAQSIFLERPEIMIGNGCQIEHEKVKQMIKKQLAQLMSLTKEVTTDELDQLTSFWLGKTINSSLILQIASFNKENKVLTIKPGIKQMPISKYLLHSFTSTGLQTKYYGKKVELNQKGIALRQIYLSEQTLAFLMNNLQKYFNNQNASKKLLTLQYIASLTSLLDLVFECKNSLIQAFKNKLMTFAKQQNAVNSIYLILEHQTDFFEDRQKDIRNNDQKEWKQKDLLDNFSNYYYIPPLNLKQFNQLRNNPDNFCKCKSRVCICIICKQSSCEYCGGPVLHAEQHHNNYCLFFNFSTGGLLFIGNQNQLHFSSFYRNKKAEKSKISQSGDIDSLLDIQKYEKIVVSLMSHRKKTEQILPLLF